MNILGNCLEFQDNIITGKSLHDWKDILLGVLKTGFGDDGTFTMTKKDFNRHLGVLLVGIGKVN